MAKSPVYGKGRNRKHRGIHRAAYHAAAANINTASAVGPRRIGKHDLSHSSGAGVKVPMRGPGIYEMAYESIPYNKTQKYQQHKRKRPYSQLYKRTCCE